MHPVAYLVDTLLSIYNMALIIWVLLGWLIAMGIVNRYNEFVYRVFSALSRVLNPAISVLRRYVPNISGFDFSPLILLVAISFFRYALRYYFG